MEELLLDIHQARVTLARAVYSNAEILLLDDVLAALDVHTAKWVTEKCLSGNLVAGRTVLLVVSLFLRLKVAQVDSKYKTHNLTLVSPIASFAVELGGDGSIIYQGQPKDVLARNPIGRVEEERSLEVVIEVSGLMSRSNRRRTAP